MVRKNDEKMSKKENKKKNLVEGLPCENPTNLVNERWRKGNFRDN
jgi:hypothetical protein